MMTAVDEISIPDSKIAREITELVRDTESPLLFHHSSRVYHWGALAGYRVLIRISNCNTFQAKKARWRHAQVISPSPAISRQQKITAAAGVEMCKIMSGAPGTLTPSATRPPSGFC
jgi:hypothetical protein